jgi:hypothetical protein
MNLIGKRFSLLFLRWVTGLVVLWQSWLSFHSAITHWHAPAHPTALAHVRLVLSGTEIVAAVLFLVPLTRKTGGYLLLVIFSLAIVIHALHGDFNGLDVLVVYAAAVLACLAHP